MLLWVSLALTAVVLAGFLYQAVGRFLDARRFPPPGRLIDIDHGRRLHLVESGNSTCPTVILEAGIAASSVSWRPIQEALSGDMRVCSYDRAGLGWSDTVSHARTANEMVEDLRTLLRTAQIRGPFVLVGHSYGGLLMRLFAAHYPNEVAGLVLVDPVPLSDWSPLTPAQEARLNRGIRLSHRGALLAHAGVVRFATALALSGARSIPALIARATSSGKGASVTQRLGREVGKLPPDLWPVVRAHWCHPKSFRSMANHLAALPASAQQALATPLPADLPIIVLTGAHNNETVRREHSEIGEQRIASASGHWIQLDQPELVIEAVHDVLKQAAHRTATSV